MFINRDPTSRQDEESGLIITHHERGPVQRSGQMARNHFLEQTGAETDSAAVTVLRMERGK